MEEKRFFTAKNVTILGVLTAIIVVLQIFGSYFRIGTISLSFVLVPIVIGGILTGVIGGTILGFIFGVITLVMGIVGADQFTFILFSDQSEQRRRHDTLWQWGGGQDYFKGGSI